MIGRNRWSYSFAVAMTLTIAIIGPVAAERAMSTDRPDRTESPYSVPAEYFQLELDFATFSRFGVGGTDYDLVTLAPFNVKYGFTDNVDVQLLFTPWIRTSYQTESGKFTEGDSGPISMRIKINLRGNDDGTTAVALLPYVAAPTNGNPDGDHTLFGIAVPVAFPLANDRAIGVMAGYEKVRNGALQTAFATATFSTPLAERWGTFLEVYYGVTDLDVNDDDLQVATLDTGLIFARTDNLAFDAGVYIGLTDDAEDWRVFAGMSVRTH
jgi:hypothetical protein